MIPSTGRLLSHRPVALTWDLLTLVFEQADDATLAVLGRVSLDFLTSTAPLLYRDIEIKSTVALRRLFCPRDDESRKPTSRINSLLSLSQLHNLHVNMTLEFPSYDDQPDFNRPLSLDLDRIPSNFYPLPIDCLLLSGTYQYLDSRFSILHTHLLPHLNPTRLSYNVRERFYDQRARVQIRGDPPLLRGWTGIKIVEMQGALVYSPVGRGGGTTRVRRLAGLAAPSTSSSSDPLPGRHTLRLYLEDLFDDFTNDTELKALQALQRQHRRYDLLGGFTQPGSLVLVVSSEDRKRKTEAAIQVLDASVRPIFVVEFAG